MNVRVMVCSLLVLPLSVLAASGNSVGKSHQPRITKTRSLEQSASTMVRQAKRRLNKALNTLTPAKKSILSTRIKKQSDIASNPYGVELYEPNYIMPWYQTFDPSPYYSNHPGHTPDGQAVSALEFKVQLSFLIPLWTDIGGSRVSLNSSYTQLMYWQLYAKSPYFRETNYEPRLFLSAHLQRNWLVSVGVDHQSNGRGGTYPDGMERSWNRVFMNVTFSGRRWEIIIEPWLPVLKKWSEDVHNPNIERYLGYGRSIFIYNYKEWQASLMLRNTIESGFQRGTYELDLSFPFFGKLHGFVQLFSGYGQSLIEYDHRTNSAGFGVALNNWF